MIAPDVPALRRAAAVADTTRWRAKNTNTFKNALLHVDPSDLVWNATYGEYTVGGDALFRAHHNDSWEWMGNGKWQEMRTINSPGRTSQNGDNHYGMSDYYPWNPDGRGCACVSCHDIAGI